MKRTLLNSHSAWENISERVLCQQKTQRIDLKTE